MFDLPEKMKSLIHEEIYSIDDIGMSDSTVILLMIKFLKFKPSGIL